MQASYLELMDDHAHIERCSDLLLAELRKPHVRSNLLVSQLHDLALFVRDHLAIEQGIVATCDAKPLPSPWRSAWIDGLDEFERLRCDWLEFLAEWDGETIDCDPDGFRLAAVDILGRLKERVEQETAGLYAVALQTGAIRFK